MNPVARLLVEFRKSRGITQDEFARIAGISRFNLASYEAGFRPLVPENYTRIQQAIAKIERENIIWREEFRSDTICQ